MSRRMAWRVHAGIAACAIVMVAAAPALAQGGRPPAAKPPGVKPPAKPHPAAPHPGSVEVSGGFAWDAGFDLGTQAATETRNINTGSGRYELFSSTSRVRPAFGVVGRLGYYLTRTVSIEGGLQYGKPELSIRNIGDTEGAQPVTATEIYNRYVFEASAAWHLEKLAFNSGSGLPFVFGGAGYVRELHGGNELVETGTEFHGGAGIKYFFTRGARRYGLRGEIGFTNRDGGVDFSDGRRTLLRGAVGFVVVF